MQAHALVQTQPAARAHTQTKCAHRDRAAGVSTALHCTHTRAHILHTHAHPFTEQESSHLLSPRAVPPQSRRSGPPPPARLGRQRCAETAVRMAECVSRSGWTVAAPKVQTCSAQRLTMWSAGRTLIFCTTRVASNAPHLRTLSRCLNACTSPARTCLGQLLLSGPHCLPSAQSAIPRDRFTPLHGALCDALTPERPSRVHCRKERKNGKLRKLRDLL